MARWLDGALSEQEHAGVTSHLAKCDECRRAAALARISLDSPVEPVDPAAEERWLAAVVRRPSLPFGARAAILAAAVLLIAITLFVVFRPNPAAPPPAAKSPTDEKVVKEDPKKEEPRKDDPKKEEVVKDVKKEEPTKDEFRTKKEDPVVTEDPRKEDIVREVPKKEEKKAGDTKTDMAAAYRPVFLLDGSGDLWTRPDEKTDFTKAGSQLTTGYGRSLRSGKNPAAFTLEGRATVAMEPDTIVWVATVKETRAYAIDFEKGGAIIDSEGLPQSWEISCGATRLVLPRVEGRVMIEAQDSKLRTHVLIGRIELKSGLKLEEGTYLDGTDVKKGDERVYKKALARLKEIRPKFRTIFAANFDETDAFAFTVAAGKLSKEGGFLATDLPGSETYGKGGAVAEVIGGLKLGEDVTYLSGVTLRFKYRGNADQIEIRAGKYRARGDVQDTKGKWVVAEIPLQRFEDEGVEMVPGDTFDELYFLIPKKDKGSNRGGVLEIDVVEFIRSSQYTH